MALTDHLKALFEEATRELSDVSPRRMFGCDAFFVRDQIFGLIWKEGRIGVRLPDEEAYAEAMRMNGAAPWKAGKMIMSHWVLVPESFHDDGEELAVWTRRAHGLARAQPKKAAKKSKAPTRTMKPKPAAARPRKR
jgi:TfoX/Sxy family transcriptional regulator of competence genes